VAEGSGISRKNKISATEFKAILQYYLPYRDTLIYKDNVWSKTGTLRDVNTLAGYFSSNHDMIGVNSFVIMLTGQNKNREKILELLYRKCSIK